MGGKLLSFFAEEGARLDEYFLKQVVPKEGVALGSSKKIKQRRGFFKNVSTCDGDVVLQYFGLFSSYLADTTSSVSQFGNFVVLSFLQN